MAKPTGLVVKLAPIIPSPTSTPPMVATSRGLSLSCIRPAGTMIRQNTRQAMAYGHALSDWSQFHSLGTPSAMTLQV